MRMHLAKPAPARTDTHQAAPPPLEDVLYRALRLVVLIPVALGLCAVAIALAAILSAPPPDRGPRVEYISTMPIYVEGRVVQWEVRFSVDGDPATAVFYSEREAVLQERVVK